MSFQGVSLQRRHGHKHTGQENPRAATSAPNEDTGQENPRAATNAPHKHTGQENPRAETDAPHKQTSQENPCAAMSLTSTLVRRTHVQQHPLRGHWSG